MNSLWINSVRFHIEQYAVQLQHITVNCIIEISLQDTFYAIIVRNMEIGLRLKIMLKL